MKIKTEKGVTGIDIIISVIVITIFITIIGNLIININLNSKETERKSEAMSYAVSEIEKIKSEGYLNEYDNVGIDTAEIQEQDILDENEEFTGYHKKIIIKDYVLIQKELNNDDTKEQDLVKEITVEISYKIGKDEKNVSLSTYVVKE